jgi:hypothetical protein
MKTLSTYIILATFSGLEKPEGVGLLFKLEPVSDYKLFNPLKNARIEAFRNGNPSSQKPEYFFEFPLRINKKKDIFLKKHPTFPSFLLK